MRVCDYVCMRVTKVYVSYYSRALFMCDILERNLTRCLSLGCVLFYTHTHTQTHTHFIKGYLAIKHSRRLESDSIETVSTHTNTFV